MRCSLGVSVMGVSCRSCYCVFTSLAFLAPWGTVGELSIASSASATEAQSSKTQGGVTSSAAMESFCDLTGLGGTGAGAWYVDCRCCATHMVGDYASQVELLYGGRPDVATAIEEDGTHPGQVPIWSLGEYVPSVQCRTFLSGDKKKKMPMCNCASEDETWQQMEPSCRPGPSCRRESQPIEWPTQIQEGIPSSARDQALGRSGGGRARVVNFGNDNCDIIGDHESNAGSSGSELAKGQKRRVSLGAGRCEDMSAEQCHLFYSKADGGWRKCEATSSSVRQCAAGYMQNVYAESYTANVEDWAVKNAFTPDAWDVNIKDDGTIDFPSELKPTREEFMKHIGNLPQRTQKTYAI